MKKKPKNGFLKENICPYCDYKTTAATMIGNEKESPRPKDLSFCLMCGGCCQFDEKMNFVKFDINSIKYIPERVRLRNIQIDMEKFWENKPDKRREEHLKIRDQRESL